MTGSWALDVGFSLEDLDALLEEDLLLEDFGGGLSYGFRLMSAHTEGGFACEGEFMIVSQIMACEGGEEGVAPG